MLQPSKDVVREIYTFAKFRKTWNWEQWLNAICHVQNHEKMCLEQLCCIQHAFLSSIFTSAIFLRIEYGRLREAFVASFFAMHSVNEHKNFVWLRQKS